MPVKLTSDDKQKQILIEKHNLLREISSFVNAYRLIILKILQSSPASFKQLELATSCSTGNLAAHLRSLEMKGVIKIKKEFVNKRPRTTYSLTKRGVDTTFKVFAFIRNISDITIEE